MCFSFVSLLSATLPIIMYHIRLDVMMEGSEVLVIASYYVVAMCCIGDYRLVYSGRSRNLKSGGFNTIVLAH